MFQPAETMREMRRARRRSPSRPLPAGADRSAGTNGWLSSWGTNAHGEIAGTPPSGFLLG